jgi:1,4-dihydroxy-2-naphthoate octaprenyltransferase
MLFCITAQLGTNLHNDYSDFVQGADTEKRVGHARATAKGWLTPSQTCAAATGALCITLCSGIYLAVATEQTDNWVVWFVIISSIFNAFAYTAGPYPLGYIGLGKCSIGYYGLGDIFVFLYFGLVATLMLPYLLMCQGKTIDWWSQGIFGTQIGLLATNIIVVNNLRDRHTDAIAGKRTTTVRFGRSFSLVEYTACMGLAYALVPLKFHWSGHNVVTLLPLISFPMAFSEMKAVHTKEGTFLNDHVGGTAKVQLVFCTFLSISLLIST